jgi:tetratricopeptide (TPR) repeat protein
VLDAFLPLDRIVTLKQAMRMRVRIAVLLAAGFFAGQGLAARATANPQNTPANPQNPPADKQKAPAAANPFPEDTNNVPVMSGGKTSAAPNVPANAAAATLPGADVDPVRSPDEPQADMSDSVGFSSSASGLDNVMPPPDTDADSRPGKKGRAAAPPPEHQESAAEDEKVADYYLSSKNWKAALSRYESAVVLDPENPEVYWGLGETQRHLGKLAEAKAAYEKLVEYDPDSKHGKEAKKILTTPEMANAPTAAAKQP